VRKVILVFLDVTESRRLDKVRRDFVANVSHELKTPITSVKGYSETILDSFPEAPEQLRSFVGVILKNADHMAHMVRDLLSLARLEHDGAAREVRPVAPAAVLRQCTETLAQALADKKMTLANRVERDHPAVLADEEGLKEVFTNLLENAVKYGPEGSEVAVEARRDGEWVIFSVTDQGPGIPAKSRERIFERFYRIGSHTCDKSGSSGLGLAICRNVVRGYGGRIWVESPADAVRQNGSAFRFTVRAAS
jgi:two-component system phosphate regulon sensor histidine kinase PhoR